MILSFTDTGGHSFFIDTHKPIDISIPLREGVENVNCFYAPFFETDPVRAGTFIGSTKEGGLLNFLNIKLNPHGNGTHTECVGHISKTPYTIHQTLKEFWFLAELITVEPTNMENGDKVILKEQLSIQNPSIKAYIIRTSPNDEEKLKKQYSGTNPIYLHHEAARWLCENEIGHLLLDLPSVDREEDGGQLLAHKAFWNYPNSPRTNATITELIYVNDKIPDGLYLLNLQIASFEIDVSPSKPVLYAINREAIK